MEANPHITIDRSRQGLHTRVIVLLLTHHTSHELMGSEEWTITFQLDMRTSGAPKLYERANGIAMNK